MIRKIIFCISFWIFSSNVFAYQNVILNYNDGTAVLDYSKSSWVNDVKKVKIYNCNSGLDSCNFEKEAVITKNTISIDKPGIYRADFHDDGYIYGFFATTTWEQFIYIQQTSDQKINEIADEYSPYLSFDKDEKFTPVSVLDIFNRKLSDFEHISIPNNKSIDQNILADQFMAANGNKDAKLFLKQTVAKGIGKKESFPTYWFHEVKDNKLYINYFWIFPYDYKANKGLPNLDGAYNHAIDREGVTLVFDMKDGAWSPTKIIYAGHLDSQKITFIGCSEPLASCDTYSTNESINVSLGKNKATISWDSTSKHNGKPIVYFAHGSHAAMPAFGWYKVETLGYDGLTERAGNNDLSKLKLGYTKALNFNSFQSNEIALSFSGYLIDVRWPSSNVRSYPFIRNPINGWFSDAASSIDVCIVNKQGCEKYVNLPVQPTQSLQAFISSLETTPVNLAGIAVSGSDIYVASLTKDLSKVRSNYDNTPFYKSNIIVTKIADKDVKWQKTIASDFYIANETGNLWQTNIGFSSDGTKLLVAASSYTGSAYSMAGGKFIVNIASPDTQPYTSLYTDDNLGWFPYFSNGQLNHFSYAGYYGCIETSCNRSIDPTAFATESHNKILQAIGLTGNLTAPMSGLRATMISRLKQLAGV